MAKSIIEIEVYNGEKAIASINEIRVSLESVGKTAKDARKELKKAIDNTTDALVGSVKTLNREKQGWMEVQDSLSTTNAEYRRYQQEIDKIDKKIAKLTDTRKREEKALKNSVNGIKQQIALLKQEQENRKISSSGYLRMQKEIDALEAKLRSLSGVKQNSIADYDRQIAALRREQKETATSREEVIRLEKQIQSLQVKQNMLTGTTKNLSKAKESFSSSAGAAGATVTEFGRTIGDLPFGLMGIANNIQQMSQQFVDLREKSGSTREAIRRFKETLLGPAGFVVAINIVTSAILYFQRQNQEAAREVKNFDESVLQNIGTLTNYIDIANEANRSAEDRNNILKAGASLSGDMKKLIDDESISEEERSERITKALNIEAKLIGLKTRRASLMEEFEGILGKNIMSEEELIDAQNRLAEARKLGSTSAQTTINNIVSEIGAQGRRKKALELFLQTQLRIIETEKEYSDVLDTSKTAQEEYADAIEKTNRQRAIDQEELESAQIQKRIEFLQQDLKNAKENSKEMYEIQAELYQAVMDLEQAKSDEKQEEIDKEADRLKELAELNQEYRDLLVEQDDESGIARLNIAQRDAIAQARALGASQEDIARIEEYYETERANLRIKIAEDEYKKKQKLEEDDQKKKDKALKANEKKLDEYFKKEIDLMKERTNAISDILSSVGQLFEELNNISQARFERQINSLNEERDLIRTNDNLTKEEKERQLTALQIKENNIQRKRIKAERDMFTLKQAITLAEMIMKQRAMVQEQIMIAQLATAKASLAANEIAVTGAKEVGKANMSLGTFMSTLGPFGTAAFALSIGGVIASIVAARRKAKAEIAGLSDAPISLGGSGGSASASVPSAPDFNVVGASMQSQLLETIGRSQDKPVKAYVVSSEVSTAQEMDRKVVEAASI